MTPSLVNLFVVWGSFFFVGKIFETFYKKKLPNLLYRLYLYKAYNPCANFMLELKKKFKHIFFRLVIHIKSSLSVLFLIQTILLDHGFKGKQEIERKKNGMNERGWKKIGNIVFNENTMFKQWNGCCYCYRHHRHRCRLCRSRQLHRFIFFFGCKIYLNL